MLIGALAGFCASEPVGIVAATGTPNAAAGTMAFHVKKWSRTCRCAVTRMISVSDGDYDSEIPYGNGVDRADCRATSTRFGPFQHGAVSRLRRHMIQIAPHAAP